MGNCKRGKQSFILENPPTITCWASVAGKKESEGPLSNTFDMCQKDTYFGQTTWEQAEKKIQQNALQILAKKANMQPKDFGLVISGDLLNQCIGSSFTLRNLSVPHGSVGSCGDVPQRRGCPHCKQEKSFQEGRKVRTIPTENRSGFFV